MMAHSSAQYLLESLIARRSITPTDQGCIELIASRLSALGFRCEPMPFGDTENLWARRDGSDPNQKVLVFAGHTDVVPTGPIDQWQSDPFVPTVRDGKLYGRGAADMKGSLAAMVCACEAYLKQHPNPRHAIAFLLTSDEEGPALDGSKRVCETLSARGEVIDYCLIGEPSSSEKLGDTIKVGRRGSLSGKLTILGRQGHIAYPHLAVNPIHLLAPLLSKWSQTEWDQGNEFFAPTGFQVSNIHAGTGAGNIIPGSCTVDFNFRYAPPTTAADLQTIVENSLQPTDHRIEWSHSGEPFQTQRAKLSEAMAAAVFEVTGQNPEFSTGGGTSDGRFIAKICSQVAEFGPINASIHQVDEHLDLNDLELLQSVYQSVLQRLVS